jgi:hypothetical protein
MDGCGRKKFGFDAARGGVFLVFQAGEGLFIRFILRLCSGLGLRFRCLG